ncbi:cytochrome P450 [Kitasatospora sp. NPDC001095]
MTDLRDEQPPSTPNELWCPFPSLTNPHADLADQQSLAWLARHELAQRQDLQDELSGEVRAVAADGSVTPEDLPRLERTGHAISETLRPHTPNWILMRRAVAPLHYGGTLLPPGAEILFSPTALHRSPRFHPDPCDSTPNAGAALGTAPTQPYSSPSAPAAQVRRRVLRLDRGARRDRSRPRPPAAQPGHGHPSPGDRHLRDHPPTRPALIAEPR